MNRININGEVERYVMAMRVSFEKSVAVVPRVYFSPWLEVDTEICVKIYRELNPLKSE